MHVPGTIPCEITLSEHALKRMSEVVRNAVRSGAKLRLVEQPRNGRAFISVHKPPLDRMCAYVDEADITVIPSSDGPRDMAFVKNGATVYRIRPWHGTAPVRAGEVTDVQPDGLVKLWDNVFGRMTIDINNLYPTAEAAEDALALI